MAKVKIGAHEYEVREVKEAFDDSNLGEHDSVEHKILILGGMKETRTFAVLLHEALHGMNTTIDHTLLDSLSEQISQFLLDNKLVDFNSLNKIIVPVHNPRERRKKGLKRGRITRK